MILTPDNDSYTPTAACGGFQAPARSGASTGAKIPREHAAAERSEALGNIAGSDFDVTASQVRRAARYELRNRGRGLAATVKGARAGDSARQDERGRFGFSAHRAAQCGGMARAGVSRLTFRQDANGGGLAGLQHCGTAGCPVCAARIGQRRSEEVAQVLTAARAQGAVLAMVTLTMRHNRGHGLRELWDALAGAWRAVTTAKTWTGESEDAGAKRVAAWLDRGRAHERAKALNDQHDGEPVPVPRAPRGWAAGRVPTRAVGVREVEGVQGVIRATEVTRGRHGWHVHVHALVVLEGRGEDTLAQHARAHRVGRAMHRLWEASLNRRGLESWGHAGGVHVDVLESTAEGAAQYVTKAAGSFGLDQREARQAVRDGLAKTVEPLALEVTRGDLKTARFKGETPFELLGRAVEGEADAVAAWREYLEVSQDRRMLVIPAALRALAGLDEVEVSDEEIVSEDEHGAEVVAVSRTEFGALRLWAYVAPLLSVLENAGPDGLMHVLRGLGAHPVDLREPEPVFPQEGTALVAPVGGYGAVPVDPREQVRSLRF